MPAFARRLRLLGLGIFRQREVLVTGTWRLTSTSCKRRLAPPSVKLSLALFDWLMVAQLELAPP